MNRRALNSAWVIRWKNARVGSPRPMVDSITPSWLRVDRAIIFLRSNSASADMPAMSIVKEAVRSMNG